MLTSLVAQWRYGLWGLITAGLVIFALQVSHWRARAHDATVAEAALKAQIAEMVQYQRALVEARRRLRDKKTEVIVKTNDVIKTVTKFVKNDPDCSFSADVIRVLNDAKRMSPAAPGTPRETAPAVP
jgi:hypothetical protein